MEWVQSYKRGEQLAGVAERLARSGRCEDARVKYAEAALAQEQLLQGFSGEDVGIGVRAVIAIRTVKLWVRAGCFDQVQRLAGDVLSRSDVPRFAKCELARIAKEAEQSMQECVA